MSRSEFEIAGAVIEKESKLSPTQATELKIKFIDQFLACANGQGILTAIREANTFKGSTPKNITSLLRLFDDKFAVIKEISTPDERFFIFKSRVYTEGTLFDRLGLTDLEKIILTSIFFAAFGALTTSDSFDLKDAATSTVSKITGIPQFDDQGPRSDFFEVVGEFEQDCRDLLVQSIKRTGPQSSRIPICTVSDKRDDLQLTNAEDGILERFAYLKKIREGELSSMKRRAEREAQLANVSRPRGNGGDSFSLFQNIKRRLGLGSQTPSSEQKTTLVA